MDFAYEKVVGTQLRTLRKNRHLTQDQLAAKLQLFGCDITRSALAKIEAGQRHLYVDELKALTAILKIPADALLPS